jgi:hypothetical protein
MQKGKILVTSSSMEFLKTSAMLKALILELQKYDKIEDLQDQVINLLYTYS